MRPMPKGTTEAAAELWEKAMEEKQIRVQLFSGKANSEFWPEGSARRAKRPASRTHDLQRLLRLSKGVSGMRSVQFSEILAVTLLHMPDYDMRCYAKLALRQSVMHDSHKVRSDIVGLTRLCHSWTDVNQSIFAGCHTGTLNLSSYPPNQEYICVYLMVLKRLPIWCVIHYGRLRHRLRRPYCQI